MSGPLTRRSFLAAIGLTPLAGCMVTGNPPLPHARIHSLRVDVGPLADRGLPNWAARIETIAQTAARDMFADALVPTDRTATDLTLVIDKAWLSSYSGGGMLLGSADTPTDWMDGWITTSPVRKLPALRRRVYVELDAGMSGAWYAPDIDSRRIENLTRAWVASARRELAE